MERDSTEHEEADDFYHKQYEERERAEYERLSLKFSRHVQHLASLAEKPIVFVEGKLDAAYLTKAFRLFRGEKVLSHEEIRQIGDENSSGGIGGGKDALNRAHQFLADNFLLSFLLFSKKFGDYGEVTEIQSFDKERFCRYICEERVIDAMQENDDFANFENVVSLIFETLLPNI
jgi:hypothetical protein